MSQTSRLSIHLLSKLLLVGAVLFGTIAGGPVGMIALAQGDVAASDDAPNEESSESDDRDRARGGTSAAAAVTIDPLIPESWTKALPWRSIGPANMGGRITAITVYEKDPSTWWAATASGGLLKTTNNGVTLEHQFDKESTVSIGDVKVAQSDPNIVWVGTGEANPRNSVSWGDGVYKSTDGGKTWTNMGLRRSFQIGRLAIHPTNPDIVYVGALGRLYGTNAERGLFKTTDGGKTWKKIHFIDDQTGVIDLQMKPNDPDTMLMATYQRQRDGYDTNDPATKWGKGSALWKTTDGGASWKRLSKGLPSGLLGRIGIDWYAKNPNTVYIILESDKIGLYPADAPYLGVRGSDAEVGVKLTRITRESPADAAGLQKDDIVLKVDGTMVHAMRALDEAIWKKKAGDKLRLEIVRKKKSEVIDVTLGTRPPPRAGRGRGNRNFSSRPLGTRLGGQRANVQLQQGERGHEYGGIYRSTDAGESWTRINSINPRPMYFSHMRVDPSDETYLYVCGVQLSRSKDGGKRFTADGGRGVHADQHALWINPNDGEHMILGCDGGIYVTYDRMDSWDHLNHVAIGQFYHVGVGPEKEYRIYGGLQDNGSWGGPSHVRNDSGPANADWFRIGGGDGFWCLVDPRDPDQLYLESQNGNMRRVNLRTGEQRSIRPGAGRGRGRGRAARGRGGRTRTRFNWETPFVLSAENPQVFYTAGNKVFRSVAKGDRLNAISPNITKGDRGAASALAESRRDPNVLWVGTDDGAVWMTRDGGANWTDAFTSKRVNTAEAAAAEAEAAEAAAEESAANDSDDGERDARQGPSRFMLRVIDRLKKSDKNGDGKVTEDEILDRQKRWFRRLDKNKDKMLDAAEFKAATAPPKPANAPDANAEGAKPVASSESKPDAKAPPKPVKVRKVSDRMKAERSATADAERPEQEVPAEKTKPAATKSDQKTKAKPSAEDEGPDRVSGRWTGAASNENMRGGNFSFTFDLKRARGNAITGRVQSRMGEGELTDGRYDPKTGKVTFRFGMGGGRSMDFTGAVKGDQLNGTVEMGGGMFSMDVETTKAGKAGAVAEAAAIPATPRKRPRARRLRDLVTTPMWVSEIVASRHRTARAYVAFDGHRSDDDLPHVYMTDNYGRNWISLRGNLPENAGSVRTIAEDIENPDVLYLGLEFGAWFSVDRGATWTKFRGDFPTVAVHAFAQHESVGDMVVGTHGRSLWVLDVTPIRQLTLDALKKDAVLLAPNDATMWRSRQRRGVTNRRFVGQNRPSVASIYYVLGKKTDSIALEVFDWKGNLVKTLTAKGDVGLHRVDWNLTRDRRADARGGAGGNRFRRGRGGRRVTPDRYTVVLTVDGEKQSHPLRVSIDPGFVDGAWLANEHENDVEEDEEADEGEEPNGDRDRS